MVALDPGSDTAIQAAGTDDLPTGRATGLRTRARTPPGEPTRAATSHSPPTPDARIADPDQPPQTSATGTLISSLLERHDAIAASALRRVERDVGAGNGVTARDR